MIEKNIGPINRTVRLIGGIVFLAAAIMIGFQKLSLLSAALAIIGLIMIAEASLAYCIWHGIRGTKDMR